MRLFLILALTILIMKVYSQSDSLTAKHKSYHIIAAHYQNGSILQTTDFIKGDNSLCKPMTKYQAYTLKMLWQNPGYTAWQKVYHCPYYGFGVTMADFYNPKEVGYPVLTYGVLGLPVVRWNKLEIYSEFQFGIASNWKHYDSIINPKNLSIGGSLTVHLDVGMDAFYHITNHIDLGAGMSFIHFSNGGFERPNNGFNIYSPSIELKYHFDGRPDFKSVARPGRLKRSNDLFIMLGYANQQLSNHELDTNYFAVGGISAIYFTQFANAFRLGYGVDANYLWGLDAHPDGTMGPPSTYNITLGFILQPEFIIDRLTLVGGIGIYALHLQYGSFEQTYQRLGVRYELYKNTSLGVNIRAINFTQAEFLEFNLGYRLRWMK